MIPNPKPARPAPATGKTQLPRKTTPASTPTDAIPPAPTLPSQYTVTDGETLWIIAAQNEIYQDPLLWPLLYRANRDQIKDPRRVYDGQTLTIPRNQNESEIAEAMATARKSDIFPLDLLMKNSPANNP
jgi:nucleoid-associated protein YgaU